MYLLPCPDCDQSISVSPSQAGDTAACSGCDSKVQIPKLGDLRKLPQAESDAPDKSSGPADGRGDFQIMTILLGIFALIGLLVAGFALVQRSLIEVTTTTDQHIAELREEYKELEAARFIRELENIEAYPPESPGEFTYKANARKRQRWLINALVAGGIGTLMLLAAIVLASSGRTPKTS